MQQNVDGNILREIMRRVPAPVTVITATDGDVYRGMTAGSFTSVSLMPPLISFNVMKDSRMHEVLLRADHFAVNILSDEQVHLSHRFAIPDQDEEDQFIDVPYHLSKEGLPILERTLGTLVCVPFAVHDAGDHTLFIGEVTRAEEGAGGPALVYVDRTYRSVAESTPIEVPVEWLEAPGGLR